ncbi:MAG: LAO/AO transport system kinase [Planctomycetota bacterium]|jgi:LAO/AO transport system kinase
MSLNKKHLKPKPHNAEYLAKEIILGNQIILSQTITLLESTKKEHNNVARKVLELVLHKTEKAIRIGITGVPGVGKSTFIESLGKMILEENRKIAVLAIDPSSQKSKGSILGDKTRMEDLTSNENVFIRPSPAGKELGGVNRKTRETILLCEACGFNTIFIETVGVGQSEISVHSMIDCFLLLMLPGAGDELQGIKKGIMEMADIVAINKAENKKDLKANKAVSNYKNALHLMPPTESGWIPKVLSCSALTNYNIETIWKTILAYENYSKVNNYWNIKRNNQSSYWIRETINQTLYDNFYNNIHVKQSLKEVEKLVLEGKISSFKAAEIVINSKQ